MTGLRVAGMMSGTSADSVDVAVCEFSSGAIPGEMTLRLLAYREEPLDSGIRDRLLRLWYAGNATLDEITELNVVLGESFAEAVDRVARDESIGPLDLIASHGQTIYHVASPG